MLILFSACIHPSVCVTVITVTLRKKERLMKLFCKELRILQSIFLLEQLFLGLGLSPLLLLDTLHSLGHVPNTQHSFAEAD